ncbi:flagellar brake protein [Aestuariibacter sp. GS-14]|uniref:flagellar brake domain-containing protein n=1 Tax=Aestuariibacter sp. GS-14 TaxID=2590670 RepID=UPI001129B067|nr:flagellar brake protein [Aestuariibacter sp. GS-14]TPV61104.1 flagellar brake protein [Aestuariibacter sp. GS-14]
MAKQPNRQLSSADLDSLLSLRPGTTVDLQISTPTAPKRVKTQYVGIDLPTSMIFQVPSESKWGYLRDILVPENEVVVRYVLEGEQGKVIAFRAEVLKVITHPSSLLFVDFPVSLQSLALRKHKRWTPGIQAQLSVSEGEQDIAIRSMIIDVSQQGCRCVCDASPDFPQLESGKAVKLMIADEKDLVCKGVVKNISVTQSKCFYGIQFSSDAEIVKKLLNRFIVEI